MNVERVLGVTLTDLGDYYSKPGRRDEIRKRLADVLERHRSERIFLIAHSMGSIVAHDVLRRSETTPSPFMIEHFITIGAPLGLPLVAEKIRLEFGAKRTPANVGRWTNLADPRDKVAFDCRLADDYAANGNVEVVNVKVENTYRESSDPKSPSNPHKSYGYLRTPEMSDRLREFLGR